MLRKLTSNTLIALGGTTAQRALGFCTTLVLARGLGQDGFGIYSFVGVYIFFFGFIVDLGMERVVTRELALAPERIGRVIGNAIILKLGLCAIAIPATLVVAWLMEVPAEARYCIWLAALGLPLSIEMLFRSYFQSQYEVKYVYLVGLPGAASFLVFAGLCVHWSLPVYAVFYAALVNGAGVLALLMTVALPRIRLRLRPERELLILLIRDAGEVGLFVVLFMLAMRIDQILLFKLSGAVEVGRYAVPVKVTEALSILPEALMLTVFPLLASTRSSAPERFRHTYRLSFKYLSAAILPIALVLTVARYEVVTLAFGHQYRDSAIPLAVLGWTMFFAYTGAVYLNLFIVQRYQRLLLLVSAVAVAVNIGCNLLLIPRYGATGAALAVLVGNIAGFTCWCLSPETRPYMLVCVREAWRPAAAVAAVAAVLYLRPLSAGAAVVAIALLYPLVLWAIGGVLWGDVAFVRRLFAQEERSTSAAG